MNQLKLSLVLVVTLVVFKTVDGQSCSSISWQTPTGQELKETETSSAYECCGECFAFKGCTAFCFHPESEYCHLWNHTGFKSSSLEVISGTVFATTTTTKPTTTPFPTSSPSGPVQCPAEEISSIPDPDDCSKYYLCVEGKPINYQCSEGQLFDDTTSRCRFSSEVECNVPMPTSTEITKFPISTTVGPGNCPLQGFHRIPHPYDCSKYYNCYEGDRIENSCPEGQLFDREDEGCKDASEADCNILTSTTLGPGECPPTEFHIIADPYDCSRFYLCDKGLKTEYTCKKGDLFDPDTLDCEPELEVECRVLTLEPSTTPSTPSTSTTLSPGECPPKGFHMIPHPDDCSKYYNCSEGDRVLHSCPEGLLFDTEDAMCKDGSAVECEI